MIGALISKILGSANDRAVKKYQKTVKQVGDFEHSLQQLKDSDLKDLTFEFKDQIQKGATLESILPKAFATAREASKRVLGMRHFDVQLIGGMVLNDGKIAEMKTGEGKTLTATLSVYLNALSGEGVHVVTVNDYLAKRDSDQMRQLYEFLGLTVGCIVHGMSNAEKRKAYACDITYGTNHEFGFDYLRDNMTFRKEEMVMRSFNYAIVDEVDSILIDEARTPLIISGPAEDSSSLYKAIDQIIPMLCDEDYEKDEKQKSVILTEAGVEKIERILLDMELVQGNNLYDPQNLSVVHHVNCALKAHKMFARDVDYIVKNDKVIIIDEFTGRMMDGRRYSDGLHQALEAKENVTIEMENQTLASITYQNFFRLYKKLSGMTGTAMTEAAEFDEIYKLETVEIPPNLPVIRDDSQDEIYMSAAAKNAAIIAQIKECNSRKQPVLVGTTSIEKSEHLSELLQKEGIPHKVLNARHHEKEATIVADAGMLSAVTIATNMAGRGTDIKLGGHSDSDDFQRIFRERYMAALDDMPENLSESEAEEYVTKLTDYLTQSVREEVAKKHQQIAIDRQLVREAGGLFVIGTERHESRRIDNQLRGRAGRQGDPGASKFYISLDDDLMRIFGSNKMEPMLKKLGAKDDEVISHRFITRALERAQQKVEARNFDIRKHLLRYDDVMNEQRKIVYEQRRMLIENQSVADMAMEMIEETCNDLVAAHIPVDSVKAEWDIKGLNEESLNIFGLDVPFAEWIKKPNIDNARIEKLLFNFVKEDFEGKKDQYDVDSLHDVKKNIMLRNLDKAWKNHLVALDHLRQGVHLRAYAQGNPLNEYKIESFNLFASMLVSVSKEFSKSLFEYINHNHGHYQPEENFGEFDLNSLLEHKEGESDFKWEGAEDGKLKQNGVDPNDPAIWDDIMRTSQCPCGSGLKFKHCHGKIQQS